MANTIQITPNDNVIVALSPISKGETIEVNGVSVTALEDVPQGHKMSVKDIAEGENVIKYGFPIGHATAAAPAGSWMHTHNVKTNLSGEMEYTYCPDVHPLSKVEPETFNGYIRKDGRAAIRNEIWIIPTVGCVNDVAKKLVNDNQDLVSDGIDGLYTFTHPFGCSQTGGDHAQTRKLLAALVRHPNAAAVLVLSLGCENLTHEQFVEELGDYDKDRVKFLTTQEVEDEFEAARPLLEECAAYARQFKRQPVPVSKLVVGMKCGGSDGLSGITANPTVGRFSDMMGARGGSTVLTEVPEMFGAEGMLMNRCINKEIFDKAVNMINGFKNYFISHNEVVYDNPSPGNKQGGITTLEDKSCGCVQKGGSAPIMDVIGYGDPVVTPGLNMLYGPGNDLVSSTAMTAAGAHMILFTTGRGTPFGAPAPTLKIATNTKLATKKAGWIDFNAGTVAEGESLDDAAKRLFDLVIEVAGGKKTKSEEKGFREISIFKDGVVL
ncbi:MAG: altronate dehydratase [Lachnospiraceae bacterium]|nr:altronate dehydratase [Lachnospiraceae bacterium]